MKKYFFLLFSAVLLSQGQALAAAPDERNAGAFGRLFFSPAERMQFDATLLLPSPATDDDQQVREQRLDGQITRGKAQRKVGVWVNGQLSTEPVPPSVRVGDSWQPEQNAAQNSTQNLTQGLLPNEGHISVHSKVPKSEANSMKSSMKNSAKYSAPKKEARE